jgi:glycosyltransferase involved in cell wall biosynthesis
LHLVEVGVRWPPETFVGWKLEGLAERGMRVTVVSGMVFDRDVRLAGVELVVLPPKRSGRWAVARSSIALLLRSPRRLLKLLRGVRRAPAEMHKRYQGTVGMLAMCLPLARLRPDVVHFEWHSAAVTYLPLFEVWGCPVVTSCRGSDTSVYPHIPGRDDYAAGLPEVLRRVSAAHCVSDSQKWEAVGLGLDPAKARVIRPADDPALFRPATATDRSLGADDGDLRVVTVGWLRWEKGHEYALEAIRLLLDSDVPARLEIIGDVPEERQGESGERERILHTMSDLGLEDHVQLHGRASSPQVARRLQASDVLMHASVTEGIPNAIVEAMACGLPVVATRCGGIPEAITHGVEGFLATPRDPDGLAEGLTRLWRDPALRRRMGVAGRAKFMSEFTLEHEHAVTLAMYREVAGP